MHELAVTQSILEIALRYVDAAQRITDLHIVVGDLSSMIDDSVQFYWDIISENTPAQGAALHFRRVPAEMRCSNCNQPYPLQADQFACPKCGSTQAELVAGEEFYLDSIEVQSTAEVAS